MGGGGEPAGNDAAVKGALAREGGRAGEGGEGGMAASSGGAEGRAQRGRVDNQRG